MAKYALVVGIAAYKDPKITAIKFAENDANQFKAVLERIGFEAENVSLLLTKNATQDEVRLGLTQILGSAKPDDEVAVYLSGHGISYAGSNHFLCYDSPQASPPSRTLPMSEVLDAMAACQATKVLLFLDCCHSGLKIPAGAKTSFVRFSRSELETFFLGQKFKAAFCSCSENEQSFVSDSLQHSVWTYYLLRALNGDEAGILEDGRYLNGSKLQDYLYANVPRTVKDHVAKDLQQTPLALHQVNHSPLIADLQKLLKDKSDARAVAARNAALVFQKVIHSAVSKLDGFDDGDELPTGFGGQSEMLVRRYGNKDVQALRSELFDSCRKLGYKVAQIQQDYDSGSASIQTPDFEINIWVTQDLEDAECCYIHSEASLEKEECLADEDKAEFFSEFFDSLALYAGKKLDLHKCVLILEELSYVGRVKTDANFTFCDVWEPLEKFWIRIKPSTVSFETTDHSLVQLRDKVRGILARLALDGLELSRGVPEASKKPRS